METFKSTFDRVKEITKVGDVFNHVSRGFSEDFETGKGFTAYHEIAETILEFVRDCSASFSADIASKALEFGNVSEKQSWCVSFEFLKIKHQFEAWVESVTKDINN